MGGDEIVGAKFRAYRPTPDHVRIDWVDGSEVSLADAQEAIEAIASLTGGEPSPVLVDMRGMRSIVREGRKTFAEADLSSRTAMYVQSALSRTVANFFLAVGRPEAPSRVFTDLDEAQEWLLDDG